MIGRVRTLVASAFRPIICSQSGITLTNLLLVGTGIAAWWGFFVAIGIMELVFPFRPVGNIGTPIFRRLEDTQFLTIAVPIFLGNKGDGSGCINDLALKLKATKTKTEWTFFPAYFLKPGLYRYEQSEDEGSKKAQLDIEGPYTPIYLHGNQSVIKPLFFLQRPPEKFLSLVISDLNSNEVYKLELHALTSGAPCGISEDDDYTLLASEEVIFDKSWLEDLGCGKTVQIIWSKLDKIREALIGKP